MTNEEAIELLESRIALDKDLLRGMPKVSMQNLSLSRTRQFSLHWMP